MAQKTKKLTTTAMLCAIAYAVMVLCKIPVVMFLKYEPKDVIITLGGMLYGPLTACLMSVTISLIELVTVSDSGLIGCLMNILSSCAFACTASFLYRRRDSLRGAVEGGFGGVILMTAVMLLWNYLITPFYMGYPREAVAAMLIPVFLPFNLLKGGINAALIILLYKPLWNSLGRAGLIETQLLPEPQTGEAKPEEGRKCVRFYIILAAAVLLVCIFAILFLQGVL